MIATIKKALSLFGIKVFQEILINPTSNDSVENNNKNIFIT